MLYLCSNPRVQTLLLLCVLTSVGCKPKSVGLKADDGIKKLRSSSHTNSTSPGHSSLLKDVVTFNNETAALVAPLLASACVWSIPVLYEELDVLSLRYTAVNGPNVSVTDTHPTLLAYPLHSQATGGTLNLQLTLNTVSVAPERIAVRPERNGAKMCDVF